MLKWQFTFFVCASASAQNSKEESTAHIASALSLFQQCNMSSGGRSASNSRRAAERSAAGVGLSSTATGSGGYSVGVGGGAQSMQQERAEILQEQDALLEKMSTSMGTLQQVAGAITGELEVQATILEDTSLAVEMAHGDIDAVTKRVNKLVEKAGGPQWCGILTCLTTVLVILTFIAFS